jgi:type IV secretion system protein TrbL
MLNRNRLIISLMLIAMLLLFPVIASAAPVDTGGILNSVVAKFQSAASNWSAALTSYAKTLFKGLAIIGLIWNCGFIILEDHSFGRVFAVFTRWMIFVGFFWWILLNGPAIAGAIVDSFAKMGGVASGVGQENLGPSTPLAIGFNILKASGNAGHWYQVGDQICMVIVLVIMLVALTIIAANLLITLCTAWLLIYGGQILLGFGAVSWTSDIAINYLRQVLGIGVTYMAMLLLVGVANSIMQDMLNGMTGNTLTWENLAVIMVVAVVLAFLVHKVPPLIGAITGNNGGAHGSFGMGAAIGAAAAVGAAIATGGAAVVAQAAGAMGGGGGGGGGGGMSALMNAVRSGGDAAGAGGSDGAAMADSMGAANDSGGQGGSALAAAMGDGGGMSAMRPSSGGSSSSRPRSFGQGAAALAHAGVSAMDSAVGGSGYNGALAPSGGGRSQSGGAQGVAGQGGNASSDASAPASSSVADDTPPAPATDQPAPTPADESTVTDTRPAPAAAAARRDAAAPVAKAAAPIFNGDSIAANDNDSAAEIAAFVNKQTPAA